jgi:outer membrane receptor protein involved in Fe transport
MRALAAVAIVCALAAPARAQEELGVSARVEDRSGGRAEDTVSREQLETQLPRSAPDALRDVPGVSVQQTAHGQASPYVRGLTGQQVVHLFDGVRLNNGIYRQGPNQYFFTVDSLTLDRLEVVRGSAGTRWGSDALGGAILAVPRERAPDASLSGVRILPRLMSRFRSADLEIGGRAELEMDLGDRVALLGGVGFRLVDLLQSGGVVGSPVDGARARVPRFTEELEGRPVDEWRTQAGTGFDEIAFDARLLLRVAPRLRLVAALYGYRQLDAPRTDRCPAPEAPTDECLRIDEQFRTLAYVALRGDAGENMRDVDLTLSYQRHHELRSQDRPRSFARNDWRDDVDTYGAAFSAATDRLALDRQATVRVRYGADAYVDRLRSSAFHSLTDLGLTMQLTRGQYLDHSTFATGGAFAWLELDAAPWLTVESGGRAAFAGARAPGDPESGTRSVASDFGALVGRASVRVRPIPELAITANVDQGFRAPNLDDLTSRQQTGPGFQFENPDLRAERSTSVELGARVRLPFLSLDAWVFATLLEDAITRVPRESRACPPLTLQCEASRTRFSLENAAGLGTIFGAEASATAFLPEGVTVRASVTYAWGEGPSAIDDTRVPFSRIPPLHGSLEGRWRHAESGAYAGAILRWAATQDRLAPSDTADARIPAGGTPGWATMDLMAGWRLEDRVLLALVVENLFDVAYRVHGSSINAPGIGVMTSASFRLW